MVKEEKARVKVKIQTHTNTETTKETTYRYSRGNLEFYLDQIATFD